MAKVPPEGPVHPLYSDRKILRLGEGVGHAGRLRPEATSHVIETKADRVGIPGLEAGRESLPWAPSFFAASWKN